MILGNHNELVRVIDTLINSIDSSKIKETNLDPILLTHLFFKSFQKDQIKPFIISATIYERAKESNKIIDVKKYSDLSIKGTIYQTYLFSFTYENDALYQALLLTNEFLDDGLIIYEKVIDEGQYLRTSFINRDLVTNVQYKIEYYEYDMEGNISREKEKYDSIIILSKKYLIHENNFLDYYDKNKLKIDKEWGNKDLVYTQDGLDSSYVHQYRLKGNIDNHLKNGKWEERSYLLENNKSVWINGEYKNGVRDGEWYYSPDGPLEKTEDYNNGRLIKTTFN